MKMRYGFVSNSSSTSFCIYGVCVDRSKVLSCQELIAKGLLKEENFKYKSYMDEPSVYMEKLGLTVETGRDGGDLYIGNNWTSVKDEETGLQFKERTIKALKQVFKDPDDIKPGTYEEAWMDN
jgi:hypothetical protein